MRTSEIINELQQLVDKNGDTDFHIYKSFSKETITPNDIFYDEELKDICIGIYD